MSQFSLARRAMVIKRANARCEYCHLSTRGQVATFPIDHITPVQQGGINEPDNLALACPHCNAHKWTASHAIDPQTGSEERLFNPRQDQWSDHFVWSAGDDGEVLGITPIGRATVQCLKMNSIDMLQLRQLLMELGLFDKA